MRTWWIAILIGAACAAGVSAQDVAVDYDRDIKPLLSDRCFKCHGPDAENREADLRLDNRAGLFRESDSGNGSHVVKPGDTDESELLIRIATDDEDLRMPPVDSNLSLSASEIKLIQRWIQSGAAWNQHWAFRPIGDVQPPATDDMWARNAIDRFVLAQLQTRQLRPNSDGTREQLIRRLTFDLTGLPPTLEEIDAFLADRSDDAYEKVVDRLLRSHRYGERMASTWLDVARYSDTYGYQVDRDRYVWPYRDWIVRAFNENLSYDQFITWQVAGDLLENATDDQILATTFNRLHPQKVEGGSVPEEFRIEYVSDRTQTFATAFLGLTFECCRCHDHKYDPISQREYYQLAAFFDKIDEAGLYSYFTPAVPTPTLLLASDKQKQTADDLTSKIAAQEQQIQQSRSATPAGYAQWIQENKTVPISGQVAHLDFEDPQQGANQSVEGKVGKAVRLTGDDGVGLKVGNFKRWEPFSVALWMRTPDMKERAVIFHRSRAWTDAGSRGYQMLIEDGKLSASLIHFWPGNAMRVRTANEIPVGQWVHVTMTYDGSSRASGLRLYVNGVAVALDTVRDNLYKHITGGGGDNLAIGQRFRDRGFTGGDVDEFRVFNRQLTPLEAQALHGAAGGSEISIPLDGEKTADLQELYRATVDADAAKQRLELKNLRQQLFQQIDKIQEIMVMREMSAPRDTYLLKRGAYNLRDEEVTATTPEVLTTFPEDVPANRRGLSQWLTDPDHPLTARVAVNRFWQIMFGEGLVRTPEDFGRQGQAPTHPELLDWLARDFVRHQWDTKRLLKMIVMSSTYRQSSQASSEVVQRDPTNQWLARAPSYRLSAEMLRDNALAVGGLLVERQGGPPSKPYDLEVSFKPVKRDKGEGLYRRSLYTYWKRTGPAPAMMTLDASKRDVCRVKRERTSSPIQAFVVLNGPQFVEAARALAELSWKAHPDQVDKRLAMIFRKLTGRFASKKELEVLRQLYEQQLEHFTKHAEAAKQYLNTGDRPADALIPPAKLAAMSVVANTLMGYDEAMMKR